MNRSVKIALAVACLVAVSFVLAVAPVDAAPQPDHSGVPGVVVAHSPQASGIYIGSPGIVILPEGTYLAKHDEFGPGSVERRSAVTRVYRSADRGRSWEHVAEVDGLFWANIFHHRGAVYMMGTDANHGRIVIRRSDDGGRAWTGADDARSGRLTESGPYHTAPMPMLIHNGRLWRAFEDAGGGTQWGARYRAMMMSAPVDADLLEAESWTFSNAVPRDSAWLDGQFLGWLEGNAVLDPAGRVVNILRVNVEGPSRMAGKAALVRISDDSQTATFDAETGFIDLPGAAKKFTIRYDPQSKAYWTLTNPVMKHTDRNANLVRNTLALMRSEDLIEWEMRCILLHHPDVVHHGFQYPDWVFDGDDMVAAIRTAYDDGIGGARNAHDANYLTFHRFENFRKLTLADSAVDPESLRPAGPGKVEVGAATVEGRMFAVRMLRNGGEAFGNRTYVWEQVPERLRGWRYTQTLGGVAAGLHATAARDTILYMATADHLEGIDTSGWTPEPDLAFRYTDHARTPLQVFRRAVRAGERVAIPEGNWTGGLLLVPPEE